jgi:large subunit ribosomal protein L25
MTKKTELKAYPRTEKGKEFAKRLRGEGKIPAVIYGKDMEPMGLYLDRQETEHLFYRISVENTIVDLAVEGEKEAFQTLIREIQTEPHKPNILHVDFLRIQKGVAVELEIPVSLEGVPVGVKEGGGVLEQMINEIRVKCIPSLIPEVVSLDVTGLGVGDALHVSDVNLGEGVEILVEPERTICSVAVPKALLAEEEEGEEGEELPEGEEAPEAVEEEDSDGDGE